MTKEGKSWLDEADIGSGEKNQSDKDTEHEISKISKSDRPAKSDRVKEDEKNHGLVDEDHPFPPKGN